MGILSKLPERLKELMFDKGISASELAAAVHTKSNTITRYLQGVSNPAYDILIRLVEYFNCSADFLLGVGELPLYERKFLPVPPFSVRFRQVIAECNTTQYALKKQTGLSWNNFHKWLNGKSLPSPDSLLVLSSALEVSVDYLLGRIS